MRVPSSDGVRVAVHDFGGTGPPLLFSHATGFHGYCYLPLADELSERFTALGLDYRGHGDTARPHDWDVDWEGYGDDAHATARSLAPDGGLIGFGHSMGGAGLLMAADRDPELFDLIIAFEPVVFPPDRGASGESSSLASGARRRTESFPSFDDAIANYASKPPMAAFQPDVLRLYVAHGFRSAPEGVRLKCAPEHEARTFEAGARHITWDRLPAIETPVVVVTGNPALGGPAVFARGVAERLANSHYLERTDWDHFAPFADPRGMAALILELTSEL